MAETVAGLISSVKSEASFDVSDATALSWLNRRHKAMVSRARALRYTASLTSVANQRDYALPANVVEIDEVSVNGLPYGMGIHRDLAMGAQGYLILGGVGGLVVSEESSSGAPEIAIYPTPTEAGLSIQVRAIWYPADLSTSDNSTLIVPDAYIDALIAGAVATGLKRVENRPDLAQPMEQEFNDACEEWRRQVSRRYRGAGPYQIRVIGVNA